MSYGELLGAETGFGQSVDSVLAGEVIAEGFTLLAEAHGDEAEERLGACGVLADAQVDDGGVDFRRGLEGARFHRHHILWFGVSLGKDAEVAVVAGAGRGGEAIRHFALDEYDGFGYRGAEAEDAFEDRRGDVIRQVTGEGDGTVGGEVGFEDILMDDGEVGVAALESGGEGGVEFNGDDALVAFDEVIGERAAAGSDFDDGSAFGEAARDALEGVGRAEKMLSETLAQCVSPSRPFGCGGA